MLHAVYRGPDASAQMTVSSSARCVSWRIIVPAAVQRSEPALRRVQSEAASRHARHGRCGLRALRRLVFGQSALNISAFDGQQPIRLRATGLPDDAASLEMQDGKHHPSGAVLDPGQLTAAIFSPDIALSGIDLEDPAKPSCPAEWCRAGSGIGAFSSTSGLVLSSGLHRFLRELRTIIDHAFQLQGIQRDSRSYFT